MKKNQIQKQISLKIKQKLLIKLKMNPLINKINIKN